MTDILGRSDTDQVPLLPTSDPEKTDQGARRGRVAVGALLGTAGVLWVGCLPALANAGISEFGLLVSGSPLFVVAIVLVASAMAVALRRGLVGAALAATIGMVAVQRLTPTLITEVPMYSWTYKHIGVVDYLQTHGELARGVGVYHDWPGVFAATAWFCDLTGLSPIALAHWWTPLYHLIMVGLVIAVARAWGQSRLTSVTAAFLVETLNWVAQDYFSPQATVMALGLGIFVVFGLSRRRPALTPVALLLFAAVVVSHQLTPYWLTLVALLLVLTRNLRPWWLPVAMGVMTLAMLWLNYDSVSHFTLFSADVVGNAQSNVPTKGVFGRQVTSLIIRGMSMGLWVTAAICAFRDRRAHRPVMARAVLAFSPFVILGAQSYGGEAIFRIFLYALPGCALLIAPHLVGVMRATTRGLRSLFRRTVATIAVVIAALASAQSYYGGWFANLMTREQVLYADYLLKEAPLPSYLMVAAPSWPERVNGRYVDFARFRTGYDYPMVYAAKLIGSDFTADADYQTFNEVVAGRTGGPTFLIISDQMEIYDWYFGLLPEGALDNLADRMRRDPAWAQIYTTDSFVVFRSTRWAP